MRIVTYGLALLWALVFPAVASAQDPPISPLPPDGFKFAGTWRCEGLLHAKTIHKSTYMGATILAGKWIELTEQDVAPASGYVAKYLIGYDSQQKQLVEFDANNSGAATYTSDEGWSSARVLIMTSATSSDPKAPYAANRFLYSISDDDTFTIDWQVRKTATSDWAQSDYLTCKRTGK
jgi:hypothetical protein